jgi:hypothetical protein
MSAHHYPALYRNRPDRVEAMQWNSADTSMQDVLAWLREEGQVFKTVGRQLWIKWDSGGRESWMVVHPGDYVVRKTEGRRYFYAEAAKNFEEAREAETQVAAPSSKETR